MALAIPSKPWSANNWSWEAFFEGFKTLTKETELAHLFKQAPAWRMML